MIAVHDFLTAVDRCVGAPIAHRGRDPKIGLDCVGVPIWALRQCGIEVPEPLGYGLVPSEQAVQQGMVSICSPVDIAARRPGDLLQLLVGRQARHVAVLVSQHGGADVIVHAVPKYREVRRTILDLSRLRAVWRVRGIG